jgi:catechol 2,3-dioxygenase
VFDDADLEKAKAHFDRSGTPARFVDVPFQGRTLHVDDSTGTPLELVTRMPTHVRAQTRAHTHKGASALRMDHYQVLVPDVAAAARFYLDLGFRTSDYVCVEGTERLVGIFLYRKNNPHDMVFLQRAGPRFHHFGYIIQEMHHAIRALDIAGNIGLGECLEHGPGRHGHGHSYYVYLRDPDGHRIELLLPATQIIDIDDEPMRYNVLLGRNNNLWGLPPPRSWFEETTPFAGARLTRPPQEGKPFTLEQYLFAKRPAAAAE